jgi:hypothetical protein
MIFPLKAKEGKMKKIARASRAQSLQVKKKAHKN